MSLISDCCGASPRGNGDNDLSDIGICSDCGEHCEYIEEDEEEDSEYKREFDRPKFPYPYKSC